MDDDEAPDTERDEQRDTLVEDMAAIVAEQEPAYQPAWDRYVYQWQSRRHGAKEVA